MSFSYRKIGARIAATGSYLPEKIVKNHDIKGLEDSNGVVERLLGAIERRAASENQSCSDIIVEAAEKILQNAKVAAKDIDRIVVSATPGDFFEPCTASVVQYKLGANCPAVDVGMSCVGWLAGMDYALRCIGTGDKRVLVLAGTIISQAAHFQNPMHRAIFGDGAGGVLLEASDECNFFAGDLWTDGQFHNMITMPHPATVYNNAIPKDFHGSFYMGDGRVITQALHENLPQGVERVLDEAGITRDDIDTYFVHQPSKPLFRAAVKAVGVNGGTVIEDFERYGNTISAELPISLDENVRNGKINRGNTILKVTFGAGFSGGVLAYKF